MIIPLKDSKVVEVERSKDDPILRSNTNLMSYLFGKGSFCIKNDINIRTYVDFKRFGKAQDKKQRFLIT